MRTIAIALLGWALCGAAESRPLAHAPAIVRSDTVEELTNELKELVKAGPLDEAKALDFGKRALELVKSGKDGATRAGALEFSYSVRNKAATAELDKLREEMWTIVLDKDIDNGVALAPLVSKFVTDEARAESIAARTKAPEVKASCALVPLKKLASNNKRTDEQTKQLIEGVRKVQKEFGKVVDPRTKKPFAEVCDDMLFPVERLVIGLEVPDIEATDTTGTKFKLSDYRGKVVMIDFWGFW